MKTYEQIKHNIARYQQKKLDWLDNYKASKGCRECQENQPYMLDLHHVIPREQNPESRLKSGRTFTSLSWKDLKHEVELCMVLCKNHHAELHYNIGGRGRPKGA